MKLRAAAIAAAAFAIPDAQAACMLGHPGVAAEYRDATYVVVARATDIRPARRWVSAGKHRYLADGEWKTVRVDRVLKGGPGQTITFFDENTSARMPLDVGKQYLLFFSTRTLTGPAPPYVNTCGNSDAFPAATATLGKVEALTGRARRRH